MIPSSMGQATALATVFAGPAGGSFGLATWLAGVKDGTLKRAAGWAASRIWDRFEMDELLAALREHPDDEVLDVCEAQLEPRKLIVLAGAAKLFRKWMHGQLEQAIPHAGEGLPPELQVHALTHIFLVLKSWEDSDLFDARALSTPKIAAATVCWEIAMFQRSIPWAKQYVLANAVTNAWVASVADSSTFDVAWGRAARVTEERAPTMPQLVQAFVDDHQLGRWLDFDQLSDSEIDVQFDSEDALWRLRMTFRVEGEHAANRTDRRARDLQLRLPDAMQDLITVRILQKG